MSLFKNMSKKTLKRYMAEIFTDLEEETDQMAHIIINPEDWVYLKKLTDYIAFATNKDFFEKGFCGLMWGVQIWLNKEIKEPYFYTKSQFPILKTEQPAELSKAIEEYEIAQETRQ